VRLIRSHAVIRLLKDTKAGLRLRSRARALPTDRPTARGVVVSLTSFPPRIRSVHLVVDSLLLQSLRPEKVVLYLADEEFPDRALPTQLRKRMGERFEVRFAPGNMRAHKKLIYALADFPSHSIVTVDDDTIYPRDLIAHLVAKAAEFPRHVVFRYGHLMALSGSGFASHMNWPKAPTRPSLWNFPRGHGGVLYPPGSLAPEATDVDLIRRLSPMSEEVWFKAMALLKGTPAVRCEPLQERDHALAVRRSESLMHHNNTLGQKDGQLAATFAHFGLVPEPGADLAPAPYFHPQKRRAKRSLARA
jgi:hypothetical protein